MRKTCSSSWCGSSFEVTDEDFAFLERVSPTIGGKTFPIPPPRLCPDCRMQRRLAFFNDRKLYRDTSDATGNSIISSVDPKKPYRIYEPSAWWSDTWDPLSYGRTVDLNAPILPQIAKLFLDVPMISLYVDGNENSEYAHNSIWNKNLYLCFCTDHSEDCLYCHYVYNSRSTVDCYYCFAVELCYECVHCSDSYNLAYSRQCLNCSDSAFLVDCQNCKHCFGCVGLRAKEYCFLNEQLSKQDYERRVSKYPLKRRSTVATVEKQMTPLLRKHPFKTMTGLRNEDSTGDELFGCKNAHVCFDCHDLWDAKYCTGMRGAKDCMDISHWGHPAELCYECAAVGEGITHLLFTKLAWENCTDLLYCSDCTACHHCFGCAGLRHRSYCIFNVQHTKEEYEKRVQEIIQSMQQRGEWGEFFPISMSPYSYNDTPASQYFPVTKKDALARGWQWADDNDDVPHVTKVIPGEKIPDSIDDIPDDVLHWAISCSESHRPLKIVKQELAFLRKQGLPLPTLHPEVRAKKRFLRRNLRKLYDRTCAKCNAAIQTTYSPERPETVYCEGCYLKEVY